MNQWLLYCILCSLIYALAAQGKAMPSSPHTLTAQLQYWNDQRLSVVDCALFMPHLGKETDRVIHNLRTKGYSPQVTPYLTIESISQADSHGHEVKDYYTEMYPPLLNLGKHTLYLTVEGFTNSRKKNFSFKLTLHRIGGKEPQLASSIQAGIISQSLFRIEDFPRCYPK